VYVLYFRKIFLNLLRSQYSDTNETETRVADGKVNSGLFSKGDTSLQILSFLDKMTFS